MNTQEVADKLVAYCREGKNDQAIEALYADNIVSHEQPGVPHPVTEGKEAVMAKSKQWQESVESINGGTISDPIITGEFFAITMDMDVTFKERGRTDIKEIAVYQVKDGKIVKEQFIYSMDM
jgi:hypothetical protein